MKKTNIIIAIISGAIAFALIGIYDFECLLTIVGIGILIGMLFVFVKTFINGYVNIKDCIYRKKLKKLQKTLDK